MDLSPTRADHKAVDQAWVSKAVLSVAQAVWADKARAPAVARVDLSLTRADHKVDQTTVPEADLRAVIQAVAVAQERAIPVAAAAKAAIREALPAVAQVVCNTNPVTMILARTQIIKPCTNRA